MVQSSGRPVPFSAEVRNRSADSSLSAVGDGLASVGAAIPRFLVRFGQHQGRGYRQLGQDIGHVDVELGGLAADVEEQTHEFEVGAALEILAHHDGELPPYRARSFGIAIARQIDEVEFPIGDKVDELGPAGPRPGFHQTPMTVDQGVDQTPDLPVLERP